jgi:hypothetical protein
MEKSGKKQIQLFYCVQLEELARKIAQQSDCIQLQSISWRFVFLVNFSFLLLFILKLISPISHFLYYYFNPGSVILLGLSPLLGFCVVVVWRGFRVLN